MLSEYQPVWQNNRVNFILDNWEHKFFQGKSILELAPLNGYIGSRFKELGANITYIEGRESHVEFLKSNHPDSTVIHANLDKLDWPFGKFDIILDFGLFYHLEFYPKEHLVNVLNNCRLCFFETIVLDSFKNEIQYVKENGDKPDSDQSLSLQGCRPSTSYIESIFEECNKDYLKITDVSLNSNSQKYDWVDKNEEADGKIRDAQNGWYRRFWIIGDKNEN